MGASVGRKGWVEDVGECEAVHFRLSSEGAHLLFVWKARAHEALDVPPEGHLSNSPVLRVLRIPVVVRTANLLHRLVCDAIGTVTLVYSEAGLYRAALELDRDRMAYVEKATSNERSEDQERYVSGILAVCQYNE